MSPKFKRNDKVKLEPSISDTLLAPTRWNIEKGFEGFVYTPEYPKLQKTQIFTVLEAIEKPQARHSVGLQQATAEKHYHYRLKAEIQTKYLKRLGSQIQNIPSTDIVSTTGTSASVTPGDIVKRAPKASSTKIKADTLYVVHSFGSSSGQLSKANPELNKYTLNPTILTQFTLVYRNNNLIDEELLIGA
ncbi:hypothetical protein M422DRAFT_62872 [Sphaerobolus stellatus SS14]|nr:hypothetical protein M422DRAFT_62872 [Sphaerobolus stellatus SS14]